jgi:hypothetical protein
MNEDHTNTANLINGYEIPTDPMDDLQCESCQ